MQVQERQQLFSKKQSRPKRYSSGGSAFDVSFFRAFSEMV
jgi:hypothetical protein